MMRQLHNTTEFLYALDAKTERTVKALSSYIPNEKKILGLLIAALTVVGFFYAYFLNSAVEHVIMRERALAESATLGSGVNELEFRYIAAESAIGLTQAHALGFVDAKKEVYISRQPLEKSLTLQNLQ